MAFQNPEDWEFSLSEDPIQFSQPSTSRRHLWDEEEPFEHHVQPRLKTDLWQLLLTSLRVLQLNVRALVIVLEAETMLVGGHQVVFEECFGNTNEGHMVIRLSDDIGHCLWLQGLLNHLGCERRASYIAKVLRHILEFLDVWTIYLLK
jgi:hypothetical protein